MSLRGKIPPWLVLLVFLIGVALLVSAVLGFRIDKRLWGELHTDTFLAAIGHNLAPEFRAEVRPHPCTDRADGNSLA